MRKSKKEKPAPRAKEFRLVGGPRDGEEIRLCNPPPKHLRLAFPEWCTYEYKAGVYEYIGDIRIPYDPFSSFDGSRYVRTA